jgi:hypothetical protein
MKAALQWMGNLLIALGLGTLATIVIVLGMLWWKGALGDGRLMGMLAALQGIEPQSPAAAAGQLDPDAEQPSIDQLLQARLRTSLDLDLRESAIDKALGDLRALEAAIRTERSRLDGWKQDFDKRLVTLETEASDAALLQLQQTLQTIHPKQAKEQIMLMLKDPPTTDDDPMHDVVTILKAMPLDKQKKILGEFKDEKEVEVMAEILRQVRLGTPDSELLRDTRSQLQQSNPMPTNP